MKIATLKIGFFGAPNFLKKYKKNYLNEGFKVGNTLVFEEEFSLI